MRPRFLRGVSSERHPRCVDRPLSSIVIDVSEQYELRGCARVDRSVGLAIGTRVWNGKPGALARFGEVMAHEPQYSQGGFPVRFDDQLWEVLDVSYVTPIAAADEAAIRDGLVAIPTCVSAT
jgi:hypothetical protein